MGGWVYIAELNVTQCMNGPILSRLSEDENL